MLKHLLSGAEPVPDEFHGLLPAVAFPFQIFYSITPAVVPDKSSLGFALLGTKNFLQYGL